MNICMFDKEDFLRINESDSDVFSMLTHQTNVMHVQVLQDVDFLQMLIYKVKQIAGQKNIQKTLLISD